MKNKATCSVKSKVKEVGGMWCLCFVVGQNSGEKALFWQKHRFFFRSLGNLRYTEVRFAKVRSQPLAGATRAQSTHQRCKQPLRPLLRLSERPDRLSDKLGLLPDGT